jgi:Protein of unknown function (DUF3617)
LNRLTLTLIGALVATPFPAAAETPSIQPGEWMVTSKTVLNGAATQPTTRARCLTPQQTGDIATTFGPQMGTVNSTCAPPVVETTGRTLTWQIECRGQMDMNVQGSFDFDSPSHYTATVSSKAWMAGSLISDVKTEVEGERVGECRQ